jgi:hypothetical protein
MRLQGRLDRLRQRVAANAPPDVPPKELWLPYNGRGDRLPGRYPCPGGLLVVVVYDPAAEDGAGGAA